MNLNILPMINACLNALSAVLLLTGFAFIRRGNREAHRICMGMAFLVSIVFLVSYLIHHALVGIIYYPGHGAARMLYFAVLWTHTPLAVVVPVLAIMTILRARRGEFENHKKIARITLPIWLYVSVTGVLVYFMLYQGFLQ